MFEQRQLFRLPRTFIIFLEGLMVALWVVMAFWGVVFIAYGIFNYNSTVSLEKAYGFSVTAIGVALLLTVRTYIRRLRSVGLTKMVVSFFNTRFLELVATAVLMLAVATILSFEVRFIVGDILTFPLVVGAPFSVIFGTFLASDLGIPFAPFVILASTWLLEVLWMYCFAKLIVKAIFLFRLRSSVD
jgi:hypothetical protein